jgi:hypothetical protein
MLRHMLAMTVAISTTILAMQEARSQCGECEYRQDLPFNGWTCLPKGGCIIPTPPSLNPIPKILRIVDAISSGDPNRISEFVGNVLINSPNCLGCNYLATVALPGLSPAQLNQIVGEGFLVFATTGDVYLVAIDVATNSARQYKIGRRERWGNAACCAGCTWSGDYSSSAEDVYRHPRLYHAKTQW